MDIKFNSFTMKQLIGTDDFLKFAYNALNESAYPSETDYDRLLTLFKYHVIGNSNLTNTYLKLSQI